MAQQTESRKTEPQAATKRLAWSSLRTLAGIVVLAGVTSAQFVFEPPQSSLVGDLTYGMAVGDIDEDGFDDVVYLRPGGLVPSLHVLFGQGDGALVEGFTIPVLASSSAGDVDLVDVNGDGHLDLGYIGADPFVQEGGYVLRLGAGDGSFGPSQASAFSFAVGRFTEFGYVDSDAHLDVVIVSMGGSIQTQFPPTIDVLIGQGDGLFVLAAKKFLPPNWGPAGLGLGDVNDDGKTDIVTVMEDGIVLVYRGFGEGSFSAPTPSTLGASVERFLMRDVTGDGRQDLVCLSHANSASPETGVWVQPGLGGGVFGAPLVSPVDLSVQTSVAIDLFELTDIDGDGILDVGVAQLLSSEVLTMRGAGDGTFVETTVISGFAHGVPRVLAAAQLDADGRPDFVVLGYVVGGESTISTSLNHTYTVAEPYTDLGFALPGTTGYPILLAEGPLLAATPYAFTLANGPSAGLAGLVVGFSAIQAPFKGGTYVPFPDVQFQGLPLDASGTLVIAGTWPMLGAGGFPLYVQGWFQDPGAVAGWSSTSGVRIDVP